MNALTRAANALNSHHVFGVGLGTAFASLAIVAANPGVSHSIASIGSSSHGFVGPIAADVASAYWSTIVSAAQAALPPAIIAAAFGRPPNVPSGPVKP